MTRAARIPYSQAEMQWLSDNRAMVISDYHRAFVAAFARTDVSAAHLHGLRKRLGWKVGRAPGRLAGRKQGRRLPFSSAEIEWLRTNCTKPIADYHSGFCAEFSRTDLSAEQLHSLRKREGWRTGRTGRFNKGNVPWSLGKKLPFNAGCTRTQFKKGNRTGAAAESYKPIGTECVRGGYLVRKIHDGLPMQSRWRAVHLLNWEKLHGPLPKGMALKCKGDRSNTDPSNWELVPRSVLPRLNNCWGRNYDQAPAELKPTIMAVAKLEHGISERRKQLTTSHRAEKKCTS
jgi:hypothetical protein